MPKLWLTGAAVITALVMIIAGYLILQPPGDLIQDAGFSLERITPNANRDNDITIFSYSLKRNAHINLVFSEESGQDFYFRENSRNPKGDYRFEFSGVVKGFQLEGESWEGDLETRLLPDGVYTWTLTAVDDAGKSDAVSGTLEIADGDSALPLIRAFEVGPLEFTPNQDGIRDRVNVNVYLEKAATLLVYLESEDGSRVYLSEREEGREPGDAGNHEFDYDGGVDQGFRPPADGQYVLYATAQDDVGQRLVRTASLRIKDSGLPQVEIVPQSTGATVCFEHAPYDEGYYSTMGDIVEGIERPTTVCSELTTLTFPVEDMLIFHLTVYNYGDTPIRTAGPFPGTVYQFDQRASSLGEYEESGAWRVGINCDTAESDFPWRWGLAPLDEVTAVYDEELDETFYYLEPGQRAEVWGAIRMTEIIDARNPQFCWAGLIHEDVGIPALQSRVGQREIELVPRPES